MTEPEHRGGRPTHGAAARAHVAGETADETIPKLPRGRGIKLSRAQLARIAATAALLVMVIAIARPCADTVSKFVTGFDEGGSGAPTMPKPGTVDRPAIDRGSAADYEKLPEHMTPAEYEAIKARQRAKHAGSGRATP